MSQDLVTLVRRSYEAANRGDLARGFEHVSPDVEWRWAGRPLRGLAEIRRVREEGSKLLDVRLEVKDIGRLGTDRVLVFVHQYSRWTERAVEGEPGEGLWTRRVDLWTFNNGLAIRYEQYFPIEGLLEFAKEDLNAATDDRQQRWWQNVIRRGQ